MNKIVKLLIFALFPLLTFTQQVYYFNNSFEYDIIGMWDNSRAIIEVDDGYIIGGMTGGENLFWYYLAFRKIDFQGNEMWTILYGEPDKQYWIGFPGSLIKTSDGGYLMCGTYKDNEIIVDAGLLVKFNEDFDVLWTKKRSDTVSPSNYLYYFFQCKEVQNEGYIVIGDKKPYGEPSKIYLVETDFSGNILWEKVYGTGSYYYQAFSVIQTTDGGYAIGGYRFLMGPSQVDADPIIYKTDSLGNLEWEKNIGGPYDDYYPVLTVANDGNIVVGTCYADSMLTPSDPSRTTNIMKINNNGDILWDKKYGESIHHNAIRNIRTLENGDYIAVGARVSDYPHNSGWTFRLSPDGDSIWYRQYDNLLGASSENYLNDVISTSDGGFAACGKVIPYPPDVGSQDAWVIKVDSMGCDTPGCATGTFVRELPPFGVGKGEELRVWPNPAKEMFKVQCSGFGSSMFGGSKLKAGNNKVLSVYNSQGLKVKEINIPAGKETLTVDVKGWQRGIYFLRMTEGGKSLGSGKVVVN